MSTAADTSQPLAVDDRPRRARRASDAALTALGLSCLLSLLGDGLVIDGLTLVLSIATVIGAVLWAVFTFVDSPPGEKRAWSVVWLQVLGLFAALAAVWFVVDRAL
ncbi:hypothetical protein [Conexibacter sp. SYSU D00693]|uniref:hypothetical protein n=1 Tax=Conexibacter sp. SYSU D00693 TaxID=2812560 RepID=UPI00196A4585|nr:hypothetical protein [Conexibacter sp. SYSU D00693]